MKCLPREPRSSNITFEAAANFPAGAEKPGSAHLRVLDIGVGELGPFALVAPEALEPDEFQNFHAVEKVARRLRIAAVARARRRGLGGERKNGGGRGGGHGVSFAGC
jgi:hypothetical protein